MFQSTARFISTLVAQVRVFQRPQFAIWITQLTCALLGRHAAAQTAHPGGNITLAGGYTLTISGDDGSLINMATAKIHILS